MYGNHQITEIRSRFFVYIFTDEEQWVSVEDVDEETNYKGYDSLYNDDSIEDEDDRHGIPEPLNDFITPPDERNTDWKKLGREELERAAKVECSEDQFGTLI